MKAARVEFVGLYLTNPTRGATSATAGRERLARRPRWRASRALVALSAP
jgi:hypothetical protein